MRPNASENGKINPSAMVRATLGDGSHPNLTSILQEGGKGPNVHVRSAVIGGNPGPIHTTVKMTPKVGIVIWFAGLVVWYIIRYPFQRKAKRIRISTSLLDRRDSIFLGFGWLGLFVIPALYALTGFPALLDRPFIPVLVWLGLVSQCAALWLFRRSHADLGRNWSVSLEIREQHALVRSGVYRLVRHPMYFSFFLLGVAQMLLLSNWFVDLSGLAAASVLFAARVGREERMMIAQFGDEYRAYMARTKRLIPWIV